jgi:putative transposase
VLQHVIRVHESPKIGRRLHGARKVYKELAREQARGEHPELGHVPCCQVERLMRVNGLKGVRRGRLFVTTRPDTGTVRPPDLVKRNFVACWPNELWVVDFTYVPTWAGMVFTAFVTDVFSRRIVGWRTRAAMPTELPLDALEMALWTRAQADQLVDGLVHHSDAGSHYTSIRCSERLVDVGVVASIGTVGDSYDNALAETTIGLYKTGCVRHEGPWRGGDDLELATLNWVWWFNNTRIHSALDYVTPVEYESAYYAHNNVQPDHKSGEPALHQTRDESRVCSYDPHHMPPGIRKDPPDASPENSGRVLARHDTPHPALPQNTTPTRENPESHLNAQRRYNATASSTNAALNNRPARGTRISQGTVPISACRPRHVTEDPRGADEGCGDAAGLGAACENASDEAIARPGVPDRVVISGAQSTFRGCDAPTGVFRDLVSPRECAGVAPETVAVGPVAEGLEYERGGF